MSFYSPGDRPPITPQLALRVAVLGFVALALFAIVFFRLWYLQVLSGDHYLVQANDNRVRDVRIAAPRGDVVDRNGQVVVDSRSATVVQLDPRSLPQSERNAIAHWGRLTSLRSLRAKGHKGHPIPIPQVPPELRRRFEELGKVIGRSPHEIQTQVVQQLWLVPYSAVTLRSDVPRSVLAFLQERKSEYPGVQVESVYLRHYPQKDLAAQLLGYVGQVTKEELKLKRYRDVRQGTIVGKDGIEWNYDRYLRGTDGARRVQVDALGQPKGEIVKARKDAVPGRNLKLTLDLGLQKEGQRALLKGMDLARQNLHAPTGAAFVAMDPRNGQVLGMGSVPSFDPSIFAKPVISTSDYTRLTSEASGHPLVNRAVSGLYPTGSTFKAITSLATLESGLITPSFSVDDTGCIQVGEMPRCNAGKQAYGNVGLVRALQVSSDVYFYKLGMMANGVPGQIVQKWARRLGLGRATGIDLRSEPKGTVPDRAWRDALNKREARCRKRKHRPCGYADGTNRQWTMGDEVNLVIGQGDLLASPLQMAVAYSGLATGGRVPRPHLGLEIEDRYGRLLQKIPQPASRRVHFSPANQQAVLQGLHLASSSAGGTSADVWKGWPQDLHPVYGKTGTAQHTLDSSKDQSWYVCYIGDPTRPIVIAVTVERGGFGAQAAAPAARLIASKWFHIKGKLVAGSSHTL
jgi:penicillin-binding protein 2